MTDAEDERTMLMIQIPLDAILYKFVECRMEAII